MGERAGALPLVGGALCLDFCNTVSGLGTSESVENLESLDDLGSWAVHAGVLAGAEAKRLCIRKPPPERADALRKALLARATLQDLFGTVAKHSPVRPSSLAAFNRLLKEADGNSVLAPAGERFAWTYSEPKGSLASVLNPILRSGAEMLVARDLHRVKACPGRGCGWLFYDDTKNGNRVWCEMRVCGSRAKSRHRSRRMEPLAFAAPA